MDTKNIKVSVIMLAYNHATYIGKAIESVLAQKTNFCFELLIGDDLSTDDTRRIISEYADHYPEIIKPVFHDKNLGSTRNLVELYRMACGIYLAHCEGDDFWTDENKLQKQYDCLEHNKGASAVMHRFDIVAEDGEKINRSLSWVKYKKVFRAKDFDGITLPGQSSTLFQRNIFANAPQKLNLFLENKFIGDRLSVLMLVKEGDIICLPEKMSAYRHRRSSSNESVTSKLYGTKLNGLIADIRLYHSMIDYAKQEHICYNIKRHKRTIYVKTWYFCLSANPQDKSAVLTELGENPATENYFLTIASGIWRYGAKKLLSKILHRLN